MRIRETILSGCIIVGIILACGCLSPAVDTGGSSGTMFKSTPHETVAPACKMGGTWSTDFGSLVLIQSGAAITGHYSHDAGNVTGKMNANVFAGTWSEAPSYKGPKDAGMFMLFVSPDCTSFAGTWGYDTSAKDGGTWNGTFVSKAP